MAQFECPICNSEFEQQSRYKRHMQTSHPKQAPSAADIESALKGIKYPKTKEELIVYAKRNQTSENTLKLIKKLPDKTYRDSAEVARAFGELKTHKKKPEHQPSELGGRRAMSSSNEPSAAKITKIFEGINLPKNAEELANYALKKQANKSELQIIRQLPKKKYEDMSDIAKGIKIAKDKDKTS